MTFMTRSASLNNYVEVAQSLGLAPYQRLAAVGIDRRALLEPNLKVPVSAVGQLLEDSARAAGVQDLGLRMAESRQLANLGPLALVMRKEPTLRKAIESLSRYTRLHNEALLTHVEEVEGLVLIREILDGPSGGQRQAAELVVGALYRILQLFLGPSWRPHSICFVHGPPASMATHRRVFGMPARFNQEFNGIVCRATELELPLPAYDQSMAQQVRRHLDSLLAQCSSDMAGQVRQLVIALLPLGVCSVANIAEQLGVDRRTVHNHLSHKSSSYSHVLNTVREELVSSYISDQERPLSDVAALLGFASLSAFSRWFSGQFGCSVTQWRARTGTRRMV